MKFILTMIGAGLVAITLLAQTPDPKPANETQCIREDCCGKHCRKNGKGNRQGKGQGQKRQHRHGRGQAASK